MRRGYRRSRTGRRLRLRAVTFCLIYARNGRLRAAALAELSRRELVPALWLPRYGRLAPRVRQSGQACPRSGPLNKSASRLPGWAAVEAAQQAWRETNPRHDLYLDVAHRSHHSNAAKAAVARKILIAAWHVLSRNEPFDPAARRTGGTSAPASSPLLSPPDGPLWN
jgi:hypothetical protein